MINLRIDEAIGMVANGKIDKVVNRSDKTGIVSEIVVGYMTGFADQVIFRQKTNNKIKTTYSIPLDNWQAEEEKPMTFMEAWKWMSEGNECLHDDIQFRITNGLKTLQSKFKDNRGWENGNMTNSMVSGKWFKAEKEG